MQTVPSKKRLCKPDLSAVRAFVVPELDVRALDALCGLWDFDRHPVVADRLARRVRRLLERAAA